MNIIKIGGIYINIDNVTSVQPISPHFAGEEGVLQIEFNGSLKDHEEPLWITGHEADALRAYLDKQAIDIVAIQDRGAV